MKPSLRIIQLAEAPIPEGKISPAGGYPFMTSVLDYLDEEAERREKWEKGIEEKVEGLCGLEKMRWEKPRWPKGETMKVVQ